MKTQRPVAAEQGGPPSNGDLSKVVELAAGSVIDLYGLQAIASDMSRVFQSVSSEFVSIAVLSGRLSAGRQTAYAGDVLVMPIASGNVQKFAFDAQALRQSLQNPGDTSSTTDFDRLIARQARQRFWGRLAPVGVNVSAPISPQSEVFRATYLNLAPIIEVRRRARGDVVQLGQLTAQAFVSAYQDKDANALAAFIDPVPFIAVSRDPQVWRDARLAFARRMVEDRRLSEALSSPTFQAISTDIVRVNERVSIRLVARDEVVFVTSMEAKP